MKNFKEFLIESIYPGGYYYLTESKNVLLYEIQKAF